MKVTLQDKDLPHQIQLVFAVKTRRCINGEMAKNNEVVVTCNCYRIGDSDGFVAYIAPAPNLQRAWKEWDEPRWHKDRKTFQPRGEKDE